ncbi:hypothetical protein ES703_81582 [subsurface metagenome]
MKRYRPIILRTTNLRQKIDRADMEEVLDGGWVRWEDVEKLKSAFVSNKGVLDVMIDAIVENVSKEGEE